MIVAEPRRDGSYIALQLDALSFAQTASNIGVALDGSAQFSVDAWARFNGLSAQAQLLAQPGVFSFGSMGPAVSFGFAGGPIVLSDDSVVALRDDTWHYVCATFDGTQVRLYIDGQFNVQQGLTPTGRPSPTPVVLGNGLQGLLRYVRVYNRALDAATVVKNMFGTPDPSSVVAYFDFSQVPPVDTGPSHYPISLKNEAQSIRVSPAVTLAATGYAQPLRDELVNPGGAQVDPYTVQAWIYVNSSVNPQQAVFVNADLESDSGMALLLESSAGGAGFNLVAVRGSATDAHRLVSSSTVSMNAWVNVATTFDGTTAAVYIGGQLAGSAAAPPIAVYRPQSELLVGAALSQGIPTGATSLQGYIRGVDVWRRALTATEIVTYMTNSPSVDDPDVAAMYQFTSSPARNQVNGHPIGLADGAVLSGQLGSPTSSEAPHEARAAFEELDEASIAKLAASVDFARLYRDNQAIFDQARERNLSGVDPRVRDRVKRAWDEVLDGLTRGVAPNFAVTDHIVGNERILIAHGVAGPRVVYRAASDTPECTMWQVRLVFIAVGGIIAAIVGVNATLSARATAFIQRLILNPRLGVFLALGTGVSAVNLLQMLGILYDAGVLKELFLMLVDLGIWSFFRFFARAVLVATGFGWVDILASLAATVVAFIAAYLQRPTSCDPLPQVNLAAIKFNWDSSTSTADALTIRKNFSTSIVAPEWTPSETLPQDAPAAYAIAQIAGKTVKIQAKFLISASTSQTIEIRATGGGVLGAIDTTTITFNTSNVSSPEFVPLNLNHQTLGLTGVSLGDVTWTWQYRVAGGTWMPMATSKHRIYTVLDIPNGPWTQSPSGLNSQRPWTEVLDKTCVWAAGATTVDAAAAAVTSKVYSGLGLKYATGATIYEESDGTGNWVFKCTQFVGQLNGTGGLGSVVNCTDCATIVSVFSNILGCNNFASVMTSKLHPNGFDCNKIIAIGWTTWDWPFGKDPGPGHFSYHEVSWTDTGGDFDPLYDACLQVDSGTNPWDWSNPGITHTALLPRKMPFSYAPGPVAPRIPTPFTKQTYRERLATNTDAGMSSCVPIGWRPKSQGGQPRVV